MENNVKYNHDKRGIRDEDQKHNRNRPSLAEHGWDVFLGDSTEGKDDVYESPGGSGGHWRWRRGG